MNQSVEIPQKDPFVISYLGLRKSIGVIAISLPFVLAIGKGLFEGPGLEYSISSYYYTVMRDVFVGSLCAIAIFLMSYRGPEPIDNLAGNLACGFALGIALFPTAPQIGATDAQQIIGMFHFIFAASFFLTLAYFSLVLFRRKSTNPTPEKLLRNKIYTICGFTILVCIGFIVLVMQLPKGSSILNLNPVFFLESTAILAFGLSWFTKGEGILADQS